MSEMDVHELADRIGGRIDDLRDQVGHAVAADDTEACRELGRSRRAVDRLTDTLETRLADVDARNEARIADLGDRLEPGRSWFSRLFWIAIGAGIGTGVAYLMDPDRGGARRAQLSDQLGSAARDARDTAAGKASYAAGVAQGAVVETAKDRFGSPDDDVDPHTLRQRVQSEVIGRTDGAMDVVVVVHDAGRVALKGRVRDAATEETLLQRTRAVAGVRDVTAELTVTG